MARIKGARNIKEQQPAEYVLTDEQRLQMLADLLLEIIIEDSSR